MTTGAEENQYWSDQVDELHHNALKNMRDVATKWQAAIVAILGTFATVAFIWGPEKLEKYPLGPGFWRGLSLSLLVIAGVLGISSAILLALAAIGIPKKFRTMTGRDLEVWTTKRAKSAGKELRLGMVLAGIAGALVVGVSAWLLAVAALAAPAPKTVSAIVSDSQGAACGTLTIDGGTLALEVDSTSRPIQSNALITVVTDCPDTSK